jgi:uncharacterized membrane protein
MVKGIDDNPGNMKLSSWITGVLATAICASILGMVNQLSQNNHEIIRLRVEVTQLNDNNKTILATLASQDERIRQLEIRNK